MRSLYLELRLLPETKPGERVTVTFPDGTCYEFIAQEVVDGGDYQRMLLDNVRIIADADLRTEGHA